MINTEYIHGYAPHDQFLNESYFYLIDIDDIEKALISLESKIEEKIFFGESTDDYLLYVESEKKNMFTAIGEAIINLFKTFFDILKDTKNSIKEHRFGLRKKISEEKTIEAMKQNPELAQQFLQSVLSGDIKARDVKDLNRLIDEATEITKKLTNGEYDKQTFSNRMEKLGENIEKIAKPIIAVIGLATSAFAFVSGVNQLIDRPTQRMNAELNLRNAYNNATHGRHGNRTLPSRDEIRRALENTYSDENGDYMTEATSPIDAVKKVLDFFAERCTFCEDATKKLKSLQATLTNKLKDAKTSEDASTIKTAMEGIRKIMAIITKEMTTVKNIANKAFKKISGGDK